MVSTNTRPGGFGEISASSCSRRLRKRDCTAVPFVIEVEALEDDKDVARRDFVLGSVSVDLLVAITRGI
jgi:hypothetical protein